MSQVESLKYDTEIDVNADGAHAKVVAMVEAVRAGDRVLELGCSTGYMSRVFRDRGCRVVGVEIDPAAAARAGAACERVILGDLDRIDLAAEVGDDRFDVVVAADVLEHLKDPVSVLRAAARLLKPDGWLVASIPNIAHGSVRLGLLGGQFPNDNELGLLDRTHLRFFTRETAERLLEDGGFAVARLVRQEKPILPDEVSFDASRLPPGLMEQLAADPDALTYQFVFAAFPLPRERMELLQQRQREAVEAADRASRDARELAGRLTAAEEAARQASAALALAGERGRELGARVAELTGQLEAARAQAEAIRAQGDAAAAELRAAARAQSAEAVQAASRLAEEAGREARQSAAERDAVRAQAARLQAAVTSLEEELKTLRGRVRSMAAREAPLREALARAQRRVVELEDAPPVATVQAEAPLPQEPQAADPQAPVPVEVPSAPPDAGPAAYRRLVRSVREHVSEIIPAGATVVVASKGDEELVKLEGRSAWHFPEGPGGVYAGFHPSDSADATARLAALRARGARYLLIPATAFWWLDHYADFTRHLDATGRRVQADEHCVIYQLDAPAPEPVSAPTPASAPQPRVAEGWLRPLRRLFGHESSDGSGVATGGVHS
jgi:2-polyprenyl-3-methyl-5-hydroxy-6-metoxy-1,4-benzoquinol methylase